MRTDIQAILAKHPQLLRRARFASLSFEIKSGSERLRVDVRDDGVSAAPVGGRAAPAGEFVLEAEPSAWAEFSQPMPRPGFNDILALLECSNATFRGDATGFYRNLFLVKGIVSAVFRGDARW